MKHIFLSVLSFSLFLFSCNESDDLVTKEVEKTETSKNSRLLWGEKVKLISANKKTQICVTNMCSSDVFFRKFQVEVANIGSNKAVKAHHQMSNGTWKDFSLTYKFTTSIGTEIWEADFYETASANLGNNNPFGSQFVIKYIVNGQTYWDNNNNQNFKFQTNVFDNETVLGSNTNILNVSSRLINIGSVNIAFEVIADVRNIAYNKEVKVIYTTDDWKTNKTEKLNYTSYYQSSINGFERWSNGNITLPFKSNTVVQYALVYKVNGIEYWDNNFGRNYSVSLNN